MYLYGLVTRNVPKSYSENVSISVGITTFYSLHESIKIYKIITNIKTTKLLRIVLKYYI